MFLPEHVVDKASEDDLSRVSDKTDRTAIHTVQALLHETEHIRHALPFLLRVFPVCILESVIFLLLEEFVLLHTVALTWLLHAPVYDDSFVHYQVFAFQEPLLSKSLITIQSFFPSFIKKLTFTSLSPPSRWHRGRINLERRHENCSTQHARRIHHIRKKKTSKT